MRPFPSLPPPNNLLIHRPLFAKSLAGVTLTYHADLALTCFVAALLGASDAGPEARHSPILPTDPKDVQLLLRILTPVCKAYTAKHAIYGVQECMESLGGVGYMENVESPEMNIARIFRDTNVLAIWEGTTDVLASDTVKVITGREGASVLAALDKWLSSTLAAKSGFDEEKRAIRNAWNSLRATFPADKEEALAEGRRVFTAVADIVCATLLIVNAERDYDDVATEVATRFAVRTFGITPSVRHNWHNVTKMDQKIAFAGSVQPAKL